LVMKAASCNWLGQPYSRRDEHKPANSRSHRTRPGNFSQVSTQAPLLRHQPTAATPVSSYFPPGSGTGTQLSG
jgi:hypothetical protein